MGTEIELLKENQKHAIESDNADKIIKSTLSPIVFTASNPMDGSGQYGEHIVNFKNVIQGDHRAFGLYTGIFTAPITGYLSSQFTINKAFKTRAAQVGIYHNGTAICNGRKQKQSASAPSDVQSGCSVAIKVNKGDSIYVRVTAGSTAIPSATV